MLIEFTVGNYRSFHESQTLSMIAAPIKSKNPSLDENCVIQLSDNPSLLTNTAVYGANASGKSNLVQALAFMKSFVMNSSKGTKAIGGIDVERFRLSKTAVNQPSHFEIVFIESGKRYRYGFEVTKERVIAEWLYFVPSTREARLFEREGDTISMGRYFKEGHTRKEQMRPNALFLSVVAQWNGTIAQNLVAWFRKLSIISGLQDVGMLSYTSRQLLEGEHSEAIKRLICRLDLGITDIQAKKLPSQKSPLPSNMVREVQAAYRTIMDAADGDILVQTVHTQYDEEGNPTGQELFDLNEHESEGTQKLFAMSGPLLDTLQKGCVLVIDELDARLHPLMTREIIMLFNQKLTNPHGAQLIFNTQDSNLLDNSLFRRDQIWFVEKNRQGATILYSLAEFRVRNDKDYERGYIQGQFGAIPYLNHVQSAVSGEYGKEA